MDATSAVMGKAHLQCLGPIYPLDLAALSRSGARFEQKESMQEQYCEVQVAEVVENAALTGSIAPDEPPTEQQLNSPSIMLSEARAQWMYTREGQRCALFAFVCVVGTALITTLFLVVYEEGVRAGKQSCPF